MRRSSESSPTPAQAATPSAGLLGFDPALAKAATRTLPLAAVVDPLSKTHAPDRIEEYRRAMISGQLFPPISVVAFGARVYVADGHKRLSAYRSLGAERITVEVWTVPRWLRDQVRQLAGNSRKNARILGLLFRSPREARRLASTTWRHWTRVASSLALRAREPD